MTIQSGKRGSLPLALEIAGNAQKMEEALKAHENLVYAPGAVA